MKMKMIYNMYYLERVVRVPSKGLIAYAMLGLEYQI
jgi:hypothetical protein